MNGRTVDWLKSMCTILGNTIYKIVKNFTKNSLRLLS